MISDFHPKGIHTSILKGGPHQNSLDQMNRSVSFPIGSRNTISILSLELRMNPDRTNGSAMLLYPDHAPLPIVKELSGEHVWFVLSNNCDAPDFMDHNCYISILERE